jgi:hypothetical protein
MKRENRVKDDGSYYVFGREVRYPSDGLVYISTLALLCLYFWLAISVWVSE